MPKFEAFVISFLIGQKESKCLGIPLAPKVRGRSRRLVFPSAHFLISLSDLSLCLKSKIYTNPQAQKYYNYCMLGWTFCLGAGCSDSLTVESTLKNMLCECILYCPCQTSFLQSGQFICSSELPGAICMLIVMQTKIINKD